MYSIYSLHSLQLITNFEISGGDGGGGMRSRAVFDRKTYVHLDNDP
jgi:hypothetical protein